MADSCSWLTGRDLGWLAAGAACASAVFWYTTPRRAVEKKQLSCQASAKTATAVAQAEHFPVYPGTCRNNKERLENTSIRLSVGEQKLACHDLVLGTQEHELGKVFGDFVIQRKDGLTSYNLATAVDDAQEITHVIRGQDLYPTTPIQLLIMQRLKLSPPTYGHIPVLTYGDGRKLSKQTLAPAIDNGLATSNLIKVFTYLGMPVPNTDEWTVEQLLQWGIGNWDLSKVPSKLRPYSA